MRSRFITILAAGILALSGCMSAPAGAEAEVDARFDTLFGAHEPYRAFFARLKTAMAADDREAVAALVDYPFQARVEGRPVVVRDAAAFVQRYGEIVTPTVRQAVAAQSYADLFANWQGVSVGDGVLWFSGIGDAASVRITAING